MFRTDLLSIISSLDTVFAAIGICHTSYVDCLLGRSRWNSMDLVLYLNEARVTRSATQFKSVWLVTSLTSVESRE